MTRGMMWLVTFGFPWIAIRDDNLVVQMTTPGMVAFVDVAHREYFGVTSESCTCVVVCLG